MKQPRPTSSCTGAHHPRRCQWIVSSLSLCLAAVLALTVLYKLHSLVPEVEPPSFMPSFPSLSSIPGSTAVKMEPPSKIAFLFLVRHKMPLDFLWEHFFQGAGGDEYTVYIHARPGFKYTKNNTQCSSFIDRQLKNPVLVEWGEASMLQAERLLLQEALKDPLNQRFILLSDSCVPLYNFRYVYNYVMFCHKSFVDSFTDAHDARYNYKMAPAIWKEGWRKGSQWFVLIRKHAVAVAKDNSVFPVFKKYCKRMALPEFSGSAENNWNHNCIPDEHYLQTLLAMRNLEKEIERRGVTYSQWKSAHQHTMDRRGWHPVTFDSAKTTLKAIKDIQNISEIHFVAAGRRERCGIDGKALPCYLFARKFTRGAGTWLLEQAAHIKIQPVNCRVKLRSLENLFPALERCKTLKRAISPSPGMKRSTRSQAAASSKRRKPTATRASRSTIQKRASGGGTLSRKARSSKPTYFSLLKDVEHALKHEHMDGASVRKLKRHLEKRYGGKPFDGETCKMLRSAVARLHKKGRIKKHPTKTHVYKFKPPSVPAHHIFGTPAQRRAGRRAASRAAKRSRPSRSSRPTRRTR